MIPVNPDLFYCVDIENNWAEIHMKWNHIQKQAKEGGRLVFAMDQNQSDIVNSQQKHFTACTTGFCTGACVWWITYRSVNVDFVADRTLEICLPYETMASIHQFLGQNWQKDIGFKKNLALSLTKLGFTTEFGLSLTYPISDMQFMNAVRYTSGFYLMSLSGGQSTQHCTAIEADPGNRKWRFFDPNHGSFIFESYTLFDNGMSDFMRESGYEKGFEDLTLIRVRPNKLTLDYANIIDHEIAIAKLIRQQR
jgi:hypothetical protein